MSSNTPKAMSSRLLTMKFMQRSAAKSVGSAPSTPNGPPAKRIRLSGDGSKPGTPGTPSDHEIIQSALAAEERKREEALRRAAETSGETKWVLSFKDPQERGRPPMQVRQAGFAVIDADDSSDAEEEQRPARMQFGGGLKKKKPAHAATPAKAQESESESESYSSEDFDSDDPTAELIRETRREVAAKERDAQKARKRSVEGPSRRHSRLVDEDADLAGLISLSGGGRNTSNMECFRCHQKGHGISQCPQPPTPRGLGSRGRGRGRR